MKRWPWLLLASTLVASAASPALAQDPQQQAMGRTLFDEAVALMKENRYSEACPKLEASLKSFPGIGTRGKLAECYEKQGKYASAWAAWREVAQLATRAGEPTREQFASERAKALEPKLSYITLSVLPANDLPGMVIKRNGKEIDRAKIGAADPVDPGVWSFEITAPGKKPYTGQVAVAQGQSKTFDVPALEAQDKVVVDKPPPPPNNNGFTDIPQPEHETSSWQRPVGYVAVGLGAVGIGIGAVLGLKAKSSYDEPFDNGLCDHATNACTADGQSKVDDARSQATISTIGFVAGGALLAGGIVLLVTAPSSKPTGSLQIAPTLGGLSISGRY